MIAFALAFALGVFFALTIHSKAHAGAYEQVVCDHEPNPVLCEQIKKWYTDATTNDGTSCCGLGDAYWTDDVLEVTPKGLYVKVTDPRSCKGPAPGYDDEEGTEEEDTEAQAGCIRKPDLDGQTLWIPNDKIDHLKQGNPTGHIVSYIDPRGNGWIYDPKGQQYHMVYCFMPGSGF